MVIALLLYGMPLVIVAGLRLVELSGLRLGLPDLERILTGTLFPFVAHIIGVIVFNTLAPFQFSNGLRTSLPKAHRAVGWPVFLSGTTIATSGLWLSLFFPVADHTTPLFTFFAFWPHCCWERS